MISLSRLSHRAFRSNFSSISNQTKRLFNNTPPKGPSSSKIPKPTSTSVSPPSQEGSSSSSFLGTVLALGVFVGGSYYGFNSLLRGGNFPSLERLANKHVPGLIEHLEGVAAKVNWGEF